MNIDEAARAMRRYRLDTIVRNGEWVLVVRDRSTMETIPTPVGVNVREFCGRLKLCAVLEALRDPSEGMSRSAAAKDEVREECIDAFYCAIVWRAMIDKLIEEVKNNG